MESSRPGLRFFIEEVKHLAEIEKMAKNSYKHRIILRDSHGLRALESSPMSTFLQFLHYFLPFPFSPHIRA